MKLIKRIGLTLGSLLLLLSVAILITATRHLVAPALGLELGESILKDNTPSCIIIFINGVICLLLGISVLNASLKD
jgi:hypothetical protein